MHDMNDAQTEMLDYCPICDLTNRYHRLLNYLYPARLYRLLAERIAAHHCPRCDAFRYTDASATQCLNMRLCQYLADFHDRY